MNTTCKCGGTIWDGTLICDACHERNKAIMNIYKTEDFTAVIFVRADGVVIDVDLTIKPLSEYGRRIRERQRMPARYKNKMPYKDTPQAKPLPVEPYRDKPTKPKPLITDRAFIFDNVNF